MDDSRSYTAQFIETCDMYGKGKGHDERKYYHFKLSPDPMDYPSPQQVHELAEQMAQRLFSAHECVIATHLDTDATHTHIIVNAVSFETGKKFHMNMGEYREAKDLADIFGEEHGFTKLDWRTKTAEKYARLDDGKALTSEAKFINGTEHSIVKRDKGKESGTSSWKEALRQAIDDAKACCTDRTEFEDYLMEHYDIIMPRNTAKTVSFVHPAVGEKYTVRGAKLGAEYTAESIDSALNQNKERSVLNARFLTSQEEYSTTDTTASTSAAVTDRAIIASQPTGKNGDGKRFTPTSVSDISAELRSIDTTVNRIAKGVAEPVYETDHRLAEHHQPQHEIHQRRHREDSRSDKNQRLEPPKPVEEIRNTKPNVQQKPKRRSNSYER
jgi:hypothetical protein